MGDVKASCQNQLTKPAKDGGIHIIATSTDIAITVHRCVQMPIKNRHQLVTAFES